MKTAALALLTALACSACTARATTRPAERSIPQDALVRQLTNVDAHTVAPLLATFANVNARASGKTNCVVVLGNPDALKLAAALIDALDSPPTDDAILFIYPLKNADAGQVAATVQKSFDNEYTSTPHSFGRQKYIIIADARSNAVLVRTERFALDGVRTILDTLDLPYPIPPKPTSIIINPQKP